MITKKKISIIGLGYVGLPLATEFAKKYLVIGYDIDITRIEELKAGLDRTKEITNTKLLTNNNLIFTNDLNYMKNSDFFILTVPTPITKDNKPNLSIIRKAALSVARVMKKGATVILESTVYPGVTEDYLVPIIEKYAKLKHKRFFCGLQSERINPGKQSINLLKLKK